MHYWVHDIVSSLCRALGILLLATLDGTFYMQLPGVTMQCWNAMLAVC